ncbi:putative baseplate assembly protein [Pseudomonas sp. WJP1]|uniref:putative baseplate assembly protein n=1 Tax=Pseudomonas sp. WJP1 TaxID=2986947 RepID=UPI00234BB05E|nr:putative baseplate assembly protein [Pseudomonas sp. WJP1]WCM54385.1 putative baseplate assembly protein [Pseudomonas sp. WJP1]
MKREFLSDNRHRLQLLRDLGSPALNGIDYLEVVSRDQRKLRVVFVYPLIGITSANCMIEGGVRITGVHIASLSIKGNQLDLTLDQAGDFSWYRFVLIDPAAPQDPPEGFDPCLSSIRFSFKAQCPSEFDCADDHSCPPQAWVEPQLDYLAKDYGSFRRLMLDRMGQLIPGFRERNPADFTVALVEMLAHIGDQLSYYQDAVATEAYLGTARRRVSLCRHARLLDYPIQQGCNSRVFVSLMINGKADGQVLRVRTPLLTRGFGPGPRVEKAVLETLPDGATQVFETLHPLPLWAAHNEIAIHPWGEPNFCLSAGAQEAALVNKPPLNLQPGMLLLLEQVPDLKYGWAANVDRSHRHVVRLVEVTQGLDPLTGTPLKLVRWHAEDALPFEMCVSVQIEQAGVSLVLTVACARANLVLADHGLTRSNETLLPDTVPDTGNYRPRLREPNIVYAQPYEDDPTRSACSSLRQDWRQAVAADMQLIEDGTGVAGAPPKADVISWTPRRDLLASDCFARAFVVETEADGSAFLRFGDNRFGLQPTPRSRLLASYRQGGGSIGNVGAESITHIICDDPLIEPHIEAVRNPLPALGGAEPESANSIKLFAPQAFRTQERAVTETDYARIAERHPEVQRAAARLRWTGSWYSMFVSIDRKGGKPMDAPFRKAMLEHLERYRLAGYDLDLSEPINVALDIQLNICVLPGYFATSVKRGLLVRLGNREDALGQQGFFHPDHFSFGQGLALSALVEAAHSVTGVASLEVKVFQRWGKTPNQEIEQGFIHATPLEVLRLDNDPNFPENGRLRLSMQGGV